MKKYRDDDGGWGGKRGQWLLDAGFGLHKESKWDDANKMLNRAKMRAAMAQSDNPIKHLRAYFGI